MGLFRKILDTLDTKEESKVEGGPIVYSPLSGEVVPLSAVNDLVFSEEMMGKGAAVIPTSGCVVAPCDGVVVSVFRTLHAITIKADNGADIIIHVGLETVSLNGKHYESHVEDGQRIKKGERLLTFDIDKIKEAGYDIITPVIVTNSAEYQSIDKTEKPQVSYGDLFLNLVK